MEINAYNTLFCWHSENFRSFPWRCFSDPYRIMIAEFMLHRTQAEQVVPVYKAFLKNYPIIDTLADAHEEDIKNVTSHLGLHWRSGHFIKAAKYILEHFGGEFPQERDDLLKIPGVGQYVAGVILTVCFNKPEHVVDSNIARFINRYYSLNLTGEIRRRKAIIQHAKKLFDTKEPGTLLFALLDFSFKICKPQNPICTNCILNPECKWKS